MLINAELLLQYQRCKRRPFLDTYSDKGLREGVNDLLLKLQQDKIAHQASVLTQFTYQQPIYPFRDWQRGERATIELMQQGVSCIYHGVLHTSYSQEYTLVSRPNLLLKQPGQSCFGDWLYVPASIELGKRPKQEYQVVAAFHALVLGMVQQAEFETAWLLLRGKESGYPVDLQKWMPQMHSILDDLIQSLETDEAPEVFISRQRCSLCPWYSQCYAIASSVKHLSLLPGVTPVRYAQLQALDITTVESLAKTSPTELENLPGFDTQVAHKLILQAKSVFLNRPLSLLHSRHPIAAASVGIGDRLDNYEFILRPKLDTASHPITIEDITFTAPIEIYFDIEAQPDLDLDYLFGVLVVDRQANTSKFYSFIAEKPEDEKLIWQQFLDLVWQYPQAPIYHFCVYEFDTVKRLARLYRTPQLMVQPVLDRFVDVYEQLTQSVALPVESYALKAIARWLGFEWRDQDASGAKCIYWYDQWLKTGDRTLLEIIQRYNEDDCRATLTLKDWLVKFFQDEYVSDIANLS